MSTLALPKHRIRRWLLPGVAIGVLAAIAFTRVMFTASMKPTAESRAFKEVVEYARTHSMPETSIRLTNEEAGPGGVHVFDFVVGTNPAHHVRIEVSERGGIEVSRMIED
jgi:hypothetical protein